MKTFAKYSVVLSILALLILPFSAGAQRGSDLSEFSPLNTSRPAPAQRSFQPKAKFNRTQNPIPNKYIVMLNDDVVPGRAEAEVRRAQVNAVAADLTQRYGGRVGFTYDALKGFSVELLS